MKKDDILEKTEELTPEQIKQKECVSKIQAILDEYEMQLGVAGFIIVPKQ